MNKYLLVALLVTCFSCQRALTPSASTTNVSPAIDAQAVAGNFSDQSAIHFDSSAIQSFLNKFPEFSSYKNDLQKFYRTRSYAYAWYDKKGLIEQASSLYNRFQRLNPREVSPSQLPYATQFKALMNDSDSSMRLQPANPQAELMFTAQYFSFARRVWQGIPEKDSKKTDWYMVRKKLMLDQLLDSLLYGSKPRTKEPVYRQYALLRTYLERYQKIDSLGGWPTNTPENKTFKKGDSSAIVRLLKKQLFSRGDYSGDTTSSRFDEEMETAAKIFQERHGLRTDGVVGSSTIRELNVPVNKVIEKIIINMERSRWVPAQQDNEYIVVNIPAYKLYVFNGDSLMWDMNVVAGKPVTQTVIFNGDLKYIVFSPYWNVPASIIEKEVNPGIQNDPDYLAKHNMERVGNTVRQKPGPNNSLGRVKFLFPNSYSIYLHDTPAKSLFSQDNRAFSHGCIRLGEPKKLAMYLLRNDPAWTAEKIDAAMNAGKEKYVTLKQTVPVFIAYFTAWVGRNGQLNMRPDIYELDTRLEQMLFTEQ